MRMLTHKKNANVGAISAEVNLFPYALLLKNNLILDLPLFYSFSITGTCSYSSYWLSLFMAFMP